MKNELFRKLLLPIAIVILLAAGAVSYIVVSRKDATNSTTAETKTTVEKEAVAIAYDGVDGENALDLLRSNHTVTMKEYSYGSVVGSIDGVENSTKKYWVLYVNNELVGSSASTYVAKAGDKVEWRYEVLK